MTAFLMIFRRFPTTVRRFTKILQNCSEGQTNVPEHFPKIPEDVRRLPKTFEGDPKMFRWYTNEFKYHLRDKRDITEIIDIFTCEDIISSHVRISYRFYQFVTTRYTTDFYIIKSNKTRGPIYAKEIWKRNNPQSNWICVWGTHEQRNYMIIGSLLSIFKMFSVLTKHTAGVQIRPVWRTFSKNALFVTN